MATTTLLLIDLQNDYFPGGSFPLPGAVQAGERAAALLTAFREQGLPVVHVRHVSTRPGATFFLPGTEGANIHPLLAPLPGEPVVVNTGPIPSWTRNWRRSCAAWARRSSWWRG